MISSDVSNSLSNKPNGGSAPCFGQAGFCGDGVFAVQGVENLRDDLGVLNTYMDLYMAPSRFGRHVFVRDKKKVAAIYMASLPFAT